MTTFGYKGGIGTSSRKVVGENSEFVVGVLVLSNFGYKNDLTIIGKNVFIGPAVVITNDPYPLSSKLVGVTIEDNAIIGASSSIKSGVRIGKNSVIGMGSLITKDVPPNTLVMGSPAKIHYSRKKYDKKREAWNKS